MTYELRVETINETTGEIKKGDMILAGYDQESFAAEVIQRMEEEIHVQVYNEFQQRGYTVWVGNFHSVASWSERVEVPSGLVWWKLHLNIDYSIYSEVPISQSPLPVWVAPALAYLVKVVAGIIIAYFVIQAVKDWLTSMTTSTTTIKEYDEDGNLVTETTTTNPDLGGMSTLGIFAIVAVLIFLFLFMGRGRGED